MGLILVDYAYTESGGAALCHRCTIYYWYTRYAYCSTYVCKSCVLVLALAANFCISEREFCAPSASVLGRDRATYVHKAARETPLCCRGPSQPLSLTSTQDTPHVALWRDRATYVRKYVVWRERHHSVAVYLSASLSRVHSRDAT